MSELRDGEPIDLGEFCAEHREFYDDSSPCIGCENARLMAEQMAEQLAAAERRGEARILQAIAAQVPSPVTMRRSTHSGFGKTFKHTGYLWGCDWCEWVETVMDATVPSHPATDCLYARALASAPRTE